MRYNEFGEEILDDTPLEAPVKFRRPPSISELIAMHVRSAMQVERAMGVESEEDFDEGMEADDILTPYELHAAAAEAHDEFRSAKEAKERLDKVRKSRDNNKTVNKDSDKGDKSEAGAKRGVDGGQRVDNDGKVSSTVGGEGRSAGVGSGGVSEGSVKSGGSDSQSG